MRLGMRMNSCNTSAGRVQTAIHWGSLSSQSNLLGKLQECISKEDAGCSTTNTQSCLLSSTCMYTPCTFKYIGIHTHTGWGWILILSFAWSFFFFNMIQIFIWWSKCLIVLIWRGWASGISHHCDSSALRASLLLWVNWLFSMCMDVHHPGYLLSQFSTAVSITAAGLSVIDMGNSCMCVSRRTMSVFCSFLSC